ncbi:MAG TPA: hypothetical protein VHN74_10400 [Candidatus Angelobacter sp.]|jgi:hypothetical protein|nr:hypothetical protein [Candidatus Angelobacter sp.]
MAFRISCQLLGMLTPQDCLWLGVIATLAVCGFLFLNRLLTKGVYDEDTAGRSDGAGAALSELQRLVNPAHKHVREERERQRSERDDSGDGTA